MRSEDRAREAPEHIRDTILLAQGFVAGMDERSFARDTRTVFAVIRCPEIISEASRRLTAEIKARHPGLPWRQIADAGNVYRHLYHAVRTEAVWLVVRDRLPELLAAVEWELARPA